MDNMNNLENATAHYCGQCKRKLPLDAFTSTNAGNVSTATAKIAARKEAVSTTKRKKIHNM